MSRKKSRCDRQIPTCSFCQRTANLCTYPTARLKPGPKLVGSTHRRRNVRSSPVQGRDITDSHSNTSHSGTLQDNIRRDHASFADEATARRLSPEDGLSDPSSPRTDSPDVDVAALNFAKAICLSRILYPSHEPSSGSALAPKQRTQPGFLLLLAGAQGNLTKACEVLRMSIEEAQSMIDLFFEMVAGLKSLSIFHQPSFPDKIRGIQDRNHLIALFAAIFSLASRLPPEHEPSQGEKTRRISHQELHTISLQYFHLSLEACANSAPPLCLLQAITLAGYYKVINGVYGPAWRLVGTGVRIAYELRLHLIDCKACVKAPTCESELMVWSFDEERRRCWWALWEMDMFCSTIQRAPTAIDWSTNETFLPIGDEYWFANTYLPSCLLRGSPEERWKRLKRSGNENSVAWGYLMGSFMHDGRLLCQESIKGIISNVDNQQDVPSLAQHYSQDYRWKAREFSDRLSSLDGAYKDAINHLPLSLSYRGEILSFDLIEGDDPFFQRRTSAGKYSVHMMSASACFMIYQNYVFADIIEGLIPLSSPKAGHQPYGRDATSNEKSIFREGLRHYLEASNMVLQLLPNCPEDHVRCVNPYYASTIWIAAALQVFKKFALRDTVSPLTQRQYSLLRRSYLQFSQFWGTPVALLQNLDSLEARLETRQRELELSESRARNTQSPDQQLQGETHSPVSSEPIMISACHEQPFPDWPGVRGSQYNTPQPSLSHPSASFPALLTDDVEWLSSMAPEFDPSMSQAEFIGQCNDSWPNESLVDNLAWYSSDVMAGLSHGYTT
ncbi:hypothetical protein LTR47_005962 [Exophiala xenobiotica]|nr:hypothetical protein LTR92_010189 [Exophiala xenobiotica]KAK5207809.1 hypothetical protein LTR41_006321 [Exophiala xenobiotica]KAK5233098.1 hypothetical protein LTR47_005962 [Exophiala xenobiotica]KAK5247506.1 hypothetical protein LTS06_007311 [Exophiala xenobiotica]KAK5373840.1 hypothetical protein LTS03_005995 [Exophiala xenobiotica]